MSVSFNDTDDFAYLPPAAAKRSKCHDATTGKEKKRGPKVKSYQLDFGESLFSSNSDDTEKKEKGLCQVCSKDLNHMNETRKLQHVNRCLDRAEAEKVLAAKRKKHNETFDCPLCKCPLAPGPFRAAHIKSCSAKYKVSAADALKLVNAQKTVADARKLCNQTHTSAKTPKLQMEPQKRTKAFALPKRVVDEEIQLAQAISLSLSHTHNSCGSSTSSAVSEPKTSETHKKPAVAVNSPCKLLQNSEAISSKLQERFMIMISKTSSRSAKSNQSKQSEWWSAGDKINEVTLSTLASSQYSNSLHADSVATNFTTAGLSAIDTCERADSSSFLDGLVFEQPIVNLNSVDSLKDDGETLVPEAINRSAGELAVDTAPEVTRDSAELAHKPVIGKPEDELIDLTQEDSADDSEVSIMNRAQLDTSFDLFSSPEPEDAATDSNTILSPSNPLQDFQSSRNNPVTLEMMNNSKDDSRSLEEAQTANTSHVQMESSHKDDSSVKFESHWNVNDSDLLNASGVICMEANVASKSPSSRPLDHMDLEFPVQQTEVVEEFKSPTTASVCGLEANNDHQDNVWDDFCDYNPIFSPLVEEELNVASQTSAAKAQSMHDGQKKITTSTAPNTKVSQAAVSTPSAGLTVLRKQMAIKIVKQSNVTPQPDYTAMATPDIKEHLGKFGLRKNLSRKRAVPILNKIYDETHPLLSNSGEPQLPADDRTAVQSSATMPAEGSTSNSGEGDSEEISYEEEDLLATGALEESGVLDVSADDLEAKSKRKPKQSKEECSAQLRELIRSRKGLYKDILCYKPIPFETFEEIVYNSNFGCSKKLLQDILDEEHITWFLQTAIKRGSKRRAPPKTKSVFRK